MDKNERLIKFRLIEVGELLSLVEHQIERGEYWGRKDQYEKRIRDIKEKLEGALK